MTALKTSLACLFIALALNVAFTEEIYPWLQLNSHSKTMEQKPEWTVIITSVKPTIRQLDTKRWEISFGKL